MKVNLEGLIERVNHLGTIYYTSIKGEIVAKVCRDCGEIKSIVEYTKHKECLGGRNGFCKMCKSERSKKYFKEHPERVRETKRKWRERNPDYSRNFYQSNRESQLQKSKEYYKQNKERLNEYGKVWRNENKNWIYNYNRVYRTVHFNKKSNSDRKWRLKNPEKCRVSKVRNESKRRARKLGLVDDITSEQFGITLKDFGGGCALTGLEEYHWDHVLPISIGYGGTTYGNMIPLRRDLNISKSNANIFEWFEANRQRFELSQERFDNLIAWLASANAMSVEEYREYVYWCHANPRSIDELKDAKEVI